MRRRRVVGATNRDDHECCRQSWTTSDHVLSLPPSAANRVAGTASELPCISRAGGPIVGDMSPVVQYPGHLDMG